LAAKQRDELRVLIAHFDVVDAGGLAALALAARAVSASPNRAGRRYSMDAPAASVTRL